MDQGFQDQLDYPQLKGHTSLQWPPPADPNAQMMVPVPNPVPIDGGILILVLSGCLLASYGVLKKKKLVISVLELLR